jgi:hypothetical protein
MVYGTERERKILQHVTNDSHLTSPSLSPEGDGVEHCSGVMEGAARTRGKHLCEREIGYE